MLDGMVLDGRNRHLAARECGAAIPTVEYDGDDPFGLRGQREHPPADTSRTRLNAPWWRRMIATLPRGRPAENVETSTFNHPTQSEAAEMLNVSRESVISARRVREHGDPSLVAEVEAGRVSVSAAAEVAKLPKAEQVEVVAGGENVVKAKAKALRTAKAATQHQESPPALDAVGPTDDQADADTADTACMAVQMLRIFPGRWSNASTARGRPTPAGVYARRLLRQERPRRRPMVRRFRRRLGNGNRTRHHRCLTTTPS